MSRVKVAGLALSVLAVLPLGATAAIPTATCRSTDCPETGISGETTAARARRRHGERSCAGLHVQHGFLVSQYQGEGASWQLTAWKNCAYFDQRHNASRPFPLERPARPTPGRWWSTWSDSTHPVPSTWLDDPAMIDPGIGEGEPGAAAARRGPETARPDGPGRWLLGLRHLHRLQEPHAKYQRWHEDPGQLRPQRSVGAGWEDLLHHAPPSPPSIVAVNVDDPAAPFGIPGGIFTFNLTDGGTPRPQDLPACATA